MVAERNTPWGQHSSAATHYIWQSATNVRTAGVPDLVFLQTADTFGEDQEVLELQQIRLDAEPDRVLFDIASDVGIRQARQVIRRLMRAEREPSAAIMEKGVDA